MRLWRALSCIFLVSLLLHRAAAAESITNSPLYLLTYEHGGVILAEQSFWMKWASCHGNAGETAACIRRLTALQQPWRIGVTKEPAQKTVKPHLTPQALKVESLLLCHGAEPSFQRSPKRSRSCVSTFHRL